MRHLLAGLVVSSVLVASQLFAAEAAGTAVPPVITTAPAPTAEKSGGGPVSAPAAEKRFRLGYADIMKVAEQSDAGKVAKAHYEAKADRHKSMIDTKQKLLEKQKATLEAKLPTYTPEQRAAKIKEYEKKVDELRKLLQKADKEMRPMQEELTKEIYGKIETAAREYGAAKGYSAIIEKRELLYLGGDVDAEDITAALIKALNDNPPSQ